MPKFKTIENIVEYLEKSGYKQKENPVLGSKNILLAKSVELKNRAKENIDVILWDYEEKVNLEMRFPIIIREKRASSKKIYIDFIKKDDGLFVKHPVYSINMTWTGNKLFED